MSITGCFMLINTERVRMVLMNKAIPAYTLESETGISRSAITRVRNGERRIENLRLDTIMKIQKWINDGKYIFKYDYSELINELEADIDEGLTGKYLYIVRGEFNEVLGKCPIVDYYYTAAEIEEGDLAEKMLTAAVVEEMERDSSIF